MRICVLLYSSFVVYLRMRISTLNQWVASCVAALQTKNQNSRGLVWQFYKQTNKHTYIYVWTPAKDRNLKKCKQNVSTNKHASQTEPVSKFPFLYEQIWKISKNDLTDRGHKFESVTICDSHKCHKMSSHTRMVTNSVWLVQYFKPSVSEDCTTFSVWIWIKTELNLIYFQVWLGPGPF